MIALLLFLATQDVTVLKGGRLLLPDREVDDGVVIIEGGRIAKAGAGLDVPAGAKVVEVPKTSVVAPGFIDLHSHLGSAFEIEERTEAVTPHVKGVEAFSSRHPDVRAALRSGVTTVAIAPGNGNLVGGRIGLVKLNGERYDRALYRDSVAIKVSLGSEALARDREPTSRTGAVAMLRELLRDPQSELRRLPLFVHAHTAGEVQSALELREEFKLRLTILHAREAAVTMDRIDAPVAFGPLTVNDRADLLSAPAKLRRGLAFVSDAPVTSEDHLRVSAALAVKHGLGRKAALAALTTVPAELLGLQEEIGSIAAGREADLVVYSGDPLSLASGVEQVLVGGKTVYRKP